MRMHFLLKLIKKISNQKSRRTKITPATWIIQKNITFKPIFFSKNICIIINKEFVRHNFNWHFYYKLQRNKFQNTKQAIHWKQQIDLNVSNSPILFRYTSIVYLPELDSLRVWGTPNVFYAFRGNVVNINMVKKLELVFFYTPKFFTVFNIKLQFNRLEDFTLNVNGLKWNYGLNKFIEKHQTITKLTLQKMSDTTNERQLVEIVRSLPLLTELNVFGPCFPVDKLIDLINKLELVKYQFVLKVPLYDTTQDRQDHISHQFNDLKIRLGHNWKASINNECVKVERNTWIIWRKKNFWTSCSLKKDLIIIII